MKDPPERCEDAERREARETANAPKPSGMSMRSDNRANGFHMVGGGSRDIGGERERERETGDSQQVRIHNCA